MLKTYQNLNIPNYPLEIIVQQLGGRVRIPRLAAVPRSKLSWKDSNPVSSDSGIQTTTGSVFGMYEEGCPPLMTSLHALKVVSAPASSE